MVVFWNKKEEGAEIKKEIVLMKFDSVRSGRGSRKKTVHPVCAGKQNGALVNTFRTLRYSELEGNRT